MPSDFQIERVRDKMIELQTALDSSTPNFVFLLKDIHDTLMADHEIVTLLKEEEIALIVRGLERHANIEIAPNVAKKAARKASKQPISASDLL